MRIPQQLQLHLSWIPIPIAHAGAIAETADQHQDLCVQVWDQNQLQHQRDQMSVSKEEISQH